MNRFFRAAAGATLFAAVVALPGARAQEIIDPAPSLQPAPHPGPTAPPPVPPIPAAQPTSGQLVPPTGQRHRMFQNLPPDCFPYDVDRASRQETLHFIFGSSYDFFGRRWQRPWPRPASQPAGTGYWTDYR